ncbi:MAG: sensor domain-containing protein, partial [Bacteroidales bacterium]|nr:sensor domain-containing protein [Bacteroidales bacterium]
LTRVFLGRTIPMKKEESSEPDFSAFIKRLFGSGSTWKGFVYYLLVKFPLDTIIWSISITFLAATLELLLAPVLHQFWLFSDEEFTGWLIDFFGDVYVLPFLGIIWGMISLHVIRGLAWVSREVNEVFLGD